MAVERTLSIIKPDATRRNHTGAIVDRFEKAGLRVIASRRTRLSTAQAEAFYGVHAARPFFRSLVDFMTSGPVVVQVLEGENAIAKNREVMGATDPAKAAAGTIRRPAFSNRSTIAPVRFRRVASGLMMESVRSTAMGSSERLGIWRPYSRGPRISARQADLTIND